MTRDPGLDLSFSGLKTALVYRVRELGAERAAASRADLAASYQRAITDQLAAKLERALERRRAGRRSRWAAASPPTPSCAGAPRRSASGAGCG